MKPGELIQTPSPPWKRLGELERRADDGSVVRWWRANYDWTVYSEDQLPLMEDYWDEFVGVFAALLPESLTARPDRVRGINLGTYNGCFQKAWMRRGFDMYGIELLDVIDELHAYGCEGHRGNLFHMAEVETDSFDFAVLDRCMCMKHFFEAYDKPLNHQDVVIARDDLGNEIEIPPFFGETFRIVKPGGVVLCIFYEYWSRRIIEELSSYGRLTLWPLSGWHPRLIARVETDREAQPLPTVDQHLTSLEAQFEPKALQAALADSPLTYGSGGASDERVRYLYLPDNALVEIAVSSTGAVKTWEAFWEDTDWWGDFFGMPLTIEWPGAPDVDHRILLLADDPRWNPASGKGYAATMADALGGHRFAVVPQRIRGTTHLMGNLSKIAVGSTDATVLISLSRFDAWPNPRTGRSRLPYEAHSSNLTEIIAATRSTARRVIWFPAIPLGGFSAGDLAQDESDRINYWINEFNEMDADLAAGLGCELVDLGELLRDQGLFSKNGKWLSKKGESELVRVLMEALA